VQDAARVNVYASRGVAVREAFAGRRVLQDPSDEPASALLERIRAERAAAPAKAKARTKRGRAKDAVQSPL